MAKVFSNHTRPTLRSLRSHAVLASLHALPETEPEPERKSETETDLEKKKQVASIQLATVSQFNHPT
jgi:hypothetical protein